MSAVTEEGLYTGGNLKIPVSFIKGRGENRQEGFQARVRAGNSHPCDVPNLMGKGHSPHPGVQTGGCTHESIFSEKVTSVGSQEGGTSCPGTPEVLLIVATSSCKTTIIVCEQV